MCVSTIVNNAPWFAQAAVLPGVMRQHFCLSVTHPALQPIAMVPEVSVQLLICLHDHTPVQAWLQRRMDKNW